MLNTVYRLVAPRRFEVAFNDIDLNLSLIHIYRAVEQKWRQKWEENPINVNDGKKPKYYCLCLLYTSFNGIFQNRKIGNVSKQG